MAKARAPKRVRGVKPVPAAGMYDDASLGALARRGVVDVPARAITLAPGSEPEGGGQFVTRRGIAGLSAQDDTGALVARRGIVPDDYAGVDGRIPDVRSGVAGALGGPDGGMGASGALPAPAGIAALGGPAAGAPATEPALRKRVGNRSRLLGGIGLAALAYGAGRSGAGGDDDRTEQLRRDAERDALNMVHRSELRSEIERSALMNLARLQQEAPDVYSRVSSGMDIPAGSVVIGGRPRVDLLARLGRLMSEGTR